MSFTSAPNAAAPFVADRWRDVGLATGARGLSVAGDFLASGALVLALQDRGASGYTVSALMLAAAVPMIVFAPVGGRIADRVDSRVLLTSVGLAQALCCAVMANVSSPVLLVALVGLLATGLAVTQPTFGALLPEMVRPERLPKAIALNQTASSIGILIGPALAGFLVGAVGLRVPLLIDAVSYLAVVAAGLLIKTRRNQAGRVGKPADRDWRLRQDPVLFGVVVATAVAVLAVGVVNVTYVFFVRDTLGASMVAFGLVESAWTAAMLVGAWAVTRFVGTDRRLAVVMVVVLLGLGASNLAVAGVPTIAWLVAVCLVGGLFNGAVNTVAQLLIARRVPPAGRGRALGVWAGAVNGAMAAGLALAGPLLEHLSTRGTIAAAGLAAVLMVAVVAVPVLRNVRGEPHVTEVAGMTGTREGTMVG
jgi:MFS family permease